MFSDYKLLNPSETVLDIDNPHSDHLRINEDSCRMLERSLYYKRHFYCLLLFLLSGTILRSVSLEWQNKF